MQQKLYLFGFSWWKRNYIKPFFKNKKLFFVKTINDALKKGLDNNSSICIWGKREFDEVEKYASLHHINIFRVEDGFVRSFSLGSDLTRPYSLVIDSRGIYFDPTVPSDLEEILNYYEFNDSIIERAKSIQTYLVDKKISKYNIHSQKKIILDKYTPNRKIILVPGQVEDDASILYGANGMSNLKLLQEVRSRNKSAYIIYKPHPDVLAGNRKGDIKKDIVIQYADTVITDAGIDSIMEICNEVHTMTSLTGFEALMRNKIVHTYGMPFYAGWGLTTDIKQIDRRKRKLRLEELVAAVYILYPLYIDPYTLKQCEPERVIAMIDKQKNRYNSNIFYRLLLNSRNFISRKIQLVIRVILGE